MSDVKGCVTNNMQSNHLAFYGIQDGPDDEEENSPGATLFGQVHIAAVSETDSPNRISWRWITATTSYSSRPKAERPDAGVTFVNRNEIVEQLTSLSQSTNAHVIRLRLPPWGVKFATTVKTYALPAMDKLTSLFHEIWQQEVPQDFEDETIDHA
ncbi:unnamed protein product [Schistocephalus solidus]|uniref:Uncharacterized protein n=1 Tax=Schistocephalus solidus TaxID=70667 RepID=A0A183SUP1_SCHSO|nr:unnamed protein product [Schistocephalus solidus]